MSRFPQITVNWEGHVARNVVAVGHQFELKCDLRCITELPDVDASVISKRAIEAGDADTATRLEWLNSNAPDWTIKGVVFCGPGSTLTFGIEDSAAAMLYKLTWGGK